MAVVIGAFWRLVLVQMLAEAGAIAHPSRAAQERHWLAVMGGLVGVAQKVEGCPSPLSCTLPALMEFGVSVVDRLGLEEVSRLGALALEEVRASMPLQAGEVAAARGNSEPASA